MPEPILAEVRNGVAHVSFNRPDKRNAYNRETLAALQVVLKDVATDPDVGALVLQGVGGTFCSGGDLKDVRELAHEGPDALHSGWFEPLFELIQRLSTLPVPTVAAVRGMALAGGLEFALCCDFIVVSDEAKLGDQHINAGLIPGGGATQLLTSRIGRQRALDLMLTGRRVKGAEAAEIGLALWSAPDSEFDDRLSTFVASLIDKRRQATEAIKLLVGPRINLDGIREEQAVAVRDMTSPDTLALLDSFGNG